METCISLLCLITFVHGCAENGSCGALAGNAVIQEMFGTDPDNCHTSIGGDLKFNVTDGLTDVDMPYVASVDGDLKIICNYDLIGFNLGSLEYVEGDVRVEGNKSLPNLDGLRSLKFIGGSLEIYQSGCKHPNGQLGDISGLDMLESVGGDIRIEGNPMLPTCAAEALVERLKYFPGIANLEGNDTTATCD